MDTEAQHYIADFWEVEFGLLDDMDFCEQMIREAVEIANCHILNMNKHKFEPQGLTIVTTLSESHCTIHTWPEKGYCAIDLYGCGEKADLRAGIDHFVSALKPGHTKIVKAERGIRD